MELALNISWKRNTPYMEKKYYNLVSRRTLLVIEKLSLGREKIIMGKVGRHKPLQVKFSYCVTSRFATV